MNKHQPKNTKTVHPETAQTVLDLVAKQQSQVHMKHMKEFYKTRDDFHKLEMVFDEDEGWVPSDPDAVHKSNEMSELHMKKANKALDINRLIAKAVPKQVEAMRRYDPYSSIPKHDVLFSIEDLRRKEAQQGSPRQIVQGGAAQDRIVQGKVDQGRAAQGKVVQGKAVQCKIVPGRVAQGKAVQRRAVKDEAVLLV